MSNNKKAVSLNGQNVGDKALQQRQGDVNKDQAVGAKGIAGSPLYEPVPSFIKTSTEEVLHNGNNAWLVLGRDRPASRLSGYGGRGDTQAAAIDIVAGRMGSLSKSFNSAGKRIWADPDFENDAARIYISQKTDIDDNFKLTSGRVGISKTKSGIALKADGIRIIAREGIKLITRTDVLNSQGGEIKSISGIDLIAGNDDSDLQPMVKGNNLADALRRLVVHVDKLNGIVDSLLMTQMTFNTALTHHFHFSPFFGLPTTPSPPVVAAGIKSMVDHLFQTKQSLVMHKVNLALFKTNYFSPAGSKFINSRFNNTN